MKYVENKNSFPAASHFAALVFDSIFIEGDERSKTCPGHGYPEHYESVVKYITFTDRADMEKWVNQQELQQYGRRDNYKIIEVRPLTVKLKATVE